MPGYTTMLLDQMLVAENWITPNTAVIATLTASSNLGRATDPRSPPLAGGTNIEGLAWVPTAARPNQLLIGFRNPLQGGKAIVVSLLNADAVVDRRHRPVRRGDAARSRRPRHPRHGLVGRCTPRCC